MMHGIFLAIPHTSSAFCPVAQSEGQHPCNRPTHTRRASLSPNSSAHAETIHFFIYLKDQCVNGTWQTWSPDNKNVGSNCKRGANGQPVDLTTLEDSSPAILLQHIIFSILSVTTKQQWKQILETAGRNCCVYLKIIIHICDTIQGKRVNKGWSFPHLFIETGCETRFDLECH